MKRKFVSVVTAFLVILILVSFVPVCVSAAPREVLIKHWGADLLGDVRDNNPAAVGHNCGNPAKDGFGNVIGWEAVQDPDRQEEMFNHMIFGCEEVLYEGDYVFEVRMKVSNMDDAYSGRFFNIDVYCANHASYLGNLSLTRSVINNTETDENEYGIYRLEFTVDSKHSGELLEARIHFSNACDAVVTDCSYIMLDSSVDMEDVEIPLAETVTDNAVLEDGTVITDPMKPGYIIDNYVTDTLPEGQLYMKMIFGLEDEIPEMKNSSNIFRFEVTDVSGDTQEVVTSLIFTGKNFKFETGELWTADQLYTLVMPFKVKEDMVGKSLKFSVYGYGTNNGRQTPYTFHIKQVLIADNPDIYDDPNKPMPVVHTFNERTVTGDLLAGNVTYAVYRANDTALEQKLYTFRTDAAGQFTVTTEEGYFWLVKEGETAPYIYFTVDDGETANFSIIDQVLEDKEIFTAPEEFNPESIRDIPEDTSEEALTADRVPASTSETAESVEVETAEFAGETAVATVTVQDNTMPLGYQTNVQSGIRATGSDAGNSFSALYLLIPVLGIPTATAALLIWKKLVKGGKQNG